MIDKNVIHAMPESGQQIDIGTQLRLAREGRVMTPERASAELKIPKHVLEALETGNWEQLGAPVFVRGHLRSYAKLVGVNIDDYLEKSTLQAVKPIELVSHTHTPRYQRMFENVARRAVYVVITLCFFAVPVWLVVSNGRGQQPLKTASLDELPPPVSAPAQSKTVAAEQRSPTAAVPSEPDNAPITASMAPRLNQEPTQASQAAPALKLTFDGDSWVEILGPDGKTIERGLLKAGQERDFVPGQVGRIKLGNATAVQVQQGGSNVDLSPYQRANVARFAVSSDGSLAPVQD